ncbi:hypothetical protein NBRC116596_24810 [Litorivita sp. NS0012-18]
MIAALALCLLPHSGGAQEVPPAPAQSYILDLADYLTDAQEADISQQLLALKARSGVEMAVLTHPSAPQFEAYATRVFDAWGIGDKSRNDGILLLITRAERAVRLELGAGYGREWDRAAADVIDREMMPHLRADDINAAVASAIAATQRRIITPYQAGDPAPAPKGGSNWPVWLIGALIALTAISRAFKSRLAALFGRMSRCPQCQQRGLKRQVTALRPATRVLGGLRRVQVTCPHCGYSQSREEPTAPIRTSTYSGGGGFGGGRSGGGGASGRF